MLGGQTWSIIQDEDTYADTVDFEGPVGVVTVRVPQLRYSWAMGKNLAAQFAIEDPSSPTFLMDDGAGGSQTASSRDRLPHFLGAIRWRPSWGAVNVSGIVGKVHYDEGGLDDELTVSALHLGAHVNLLENTRLMATFNVGEGGTGIYMVGAPAAATLDADGKLSAMESMGGFFGLTHRFSETMESGVYYGWVENDFEDYAKETFAGQHSETLRTLHANLWWAPAPKVRIGLEFMQGWRETNGGEEGDATRIQLGLQYSF